jgi:putative transcriptional regulator
VGSAPIARLSRFLSVLGTTDRISADGRDLEDAVKRSVSGCFLIAAPHMSDPNFTRSVVFMAEHSPKGAFGLVVNRPTSLKIAKLWEAIGGDTSGVGEQRAFVGGPVETRVIHFLHSCADLAPGQDPVVPGVFIGNDAGLFESLISRDRELRAGGNERVIFRAFCGFSGWGEGQLDDELETGSWIVQPATPDLVFTDDVTTLWSRVLEREGGIYRLFAHMPSNPEMN